MRRNWLDAADELHFPTTEDFNGAHPLGLGCYQVTIRNGVRRPAPDAFLRPALRRGNVKLETHPWASKIRIQQRRASASYHPHPRPPNFPPPHPPLHHHP